MPFIFNPVIYYDSFLFFIPQPLDQVRLRDSWDLATRKVPLVEGDSIVSSSRRGTEIIFEGRCSSQNASILLSEEEMFIELRNLRLALQTPESSDTYTLFIYYDDVEGVYQKFKSCSTRHYEFDISDPTLFSFSIVIYAADPDIYGTPPGL